MAGYEDTKQKIISTLMGRPNGTEIQPENHQDYALNMLDYIRSLELIATSTLIGTAESNTTPVQPNSSRVCYIAGVAQNQTVVFKNFIDENGNPISVTTGDMEGVFIILLWNTQYWSAQTFSTNIISQAESSTFYYNYNIKKTYSSVSAMNADKENPIGTDGKYIKVGDIVTVVNSTTPSENGFYSYEGPENGWLLQSGFSFEIVQTTGTSTTEVMSQKATTDNLELKIDKTAIVDELGTNPDKIMSQKATTHNLESKFNKTSIKQDLGTSTTDVMSQKATTDNLELKIDKTAIVDELGTNPDKIMSQKATTDAIMKSYNYDVNQLAYGVRLDLTGNGQTLERVGNLSLHKTRPITSKARNCVKNVAGVNYYLSDDTDLLKADGVTPSVLDGTDGDVMKEIPEFYVLEETVNNYAYTWISEFPLPNFIRIPKTYHGLYEGSYDTTTNQTRSVINATIRTGLPSTGKSRSYYNNGARLNRNITWNIDTLLSNYIRGLLFRVDYATYDSQAPYNSQPTAEGYLQGGLGAGVTYIDSYKWRYNSQNPFIPCGYTAELGNRTGVKDFYMPYEYDGWSPVPGDNTGYYKGIYNASTLYNVNEYVADTADSSIGQGDGKLYKCILTAPAGTALTNTTYFTEQIRTKVQVNRFLVEMPFGHTYKHMIDSIIELTNGYTTTKCYIYDNPEHYPTSDVNDIKTANARFLCNMPSAGGYVKTFNKYTLVPYAIGGSSDSWGYDYYYWRGEVGGVLRGLLFGGYANHGASAGFGYSDVSDSPANASANFGVRLCCFEENIVINSEII